MIRLLGRCLPIALLAVVALTPALEASPARGQGSPEPSTPGQASQARGSKSPVARFPIQLERGAPKGARFLLTSEARIFRSESVVEGEEEVQSEGSGEGEVKLTAIATVHGVNGEGGITQAEYEVWTFSGSIDGASVAQIPAGSVLRTEKTEEGTRITLDDGELTPRQLLLLVQVLETAQEDQPGDDDIFGTEEPRAVGETWPVNADQAVKAFSANGTKLSAEAVSGGSRLVERRQVAGVDCLHIEGRLDVSLLEPPGIDETLFVNARMALEFTGDYPEDNVSLGMEGKILSRMEIRHLLFEPEEEGDLPIYHLTVSESEKSFSIRPPEESPSGETSGAEAEVPTAVSPS